MNSQNFVHTAVTHTHMVWSMREQKASAGSRRLQRTELQTPKKSQMSQMQNETHTLPR